MSAPQALHGIVPSLNTPFCADDSLDLAGIERLIAYCADAGCGGLLILAVAGETASLTARERQMLLETVMASNAGHLPVDDDTQNHLYFDPGDGRLITIFTSESWKVDETPNPTGTGNLHHLAFIVSRASYTQAARRLKERGFANSGEIDRGFMDSIYFRDPLGQLLELACYKFEPPVGVTHAEVLAEAHRLRVAAGDRAISDAHLADAIAALSHRRKAPDVRGVR